MKNLVRELKKIGVIKKGNVILKSGEVSDFYIDMKKAFGLPRVFRFIIDELCKIIDPIKRRGHHGASKRATCIAGSGHGGLPLATAVAIKLRLPLVLVRDKIKKHGLQKMIDGYIPTNKDRVVIVDDVFTTGTCISNICKTLNKTNAKILAGYVVVHRGGASHATIPLESLVEISELTAES